MTFLYKRPQASQAVLIFHRSQPESALLLDKAGNLFGTTSAGGPSDDGTVFKLAPDGQGGWTETVLHAFNGKDGRWPIMAPLVADAKGNLYGVTEGACYYGCVNGTLFELSPQQNGSWSFRCSTPSDSQLFPCRG